MKRVSCAKNKIDFKRLIKCTVLVSVLIFSLALSSCFKKSNLEVFDFLLSTPTVAEVNAKIGKYKDATSTYYSKAASGGYDFGDLYQNLYKYDLTVCGIQGELQGSDLYIGNYLSDETKLHSWVWIEDIPVNKFNSFKQQVVDYYNGKYGPYTEGKNVFDAYIWNVGDGKSISFLIVDSDTLGIAVSTDK